MLTAFYIAATVLGAASFAAWCECSLRREMARYRPSKEYQCVMRMPMRCMLRRKGVHTYLVIFTDEGAADIPEMLRRWAQDERLNLDDEDVVEMRKLAMKLMEDAI